MPQRWHKISFHLCPEILLTGAWNGPLWYIKGPHCILSWTFDILIFGHRKCSLFNPQSTYLSCWVYLCYCFDGQRGKRGEGAQPLGSPRFGHLLTSISEREGTQYLNSFGPGLPREMWDNTTFTSASDLCVSEASHIPSVGFHGLAGAWKIVVKWKIGAITSLLLEVCCSHSTEQ